MPETDYINSIVKVAVNALENIKGKDIIIIDTSKQSTLFSRMIIATGDSTTQVRALGRNVDEELKLSGYKVLGIEGTQNSEWVLVDAGEVIIHTMLPAIRDFYDIETLWAAEKPNYQDLKIS